MLYYNTKPWFNTLKFRDIFPDVETFITKMHAAMNQYEKDNLVQLEDLYRVLSLKYYNAPTRYETPENFTSALIREIRIHWIIYLQQENLLNAAMQLDIEEVMKSGQSIRNLVENPNELNQDMDEKAIKHTSTQQESLVNKSGQLNAINYKYNAIRKNYLDDFYYNAIQPLFRHFVSDDQSLVFVDKE